MRSLSVKLIGAFAVVIVVSAVITYVVAALTLPSQFDLYVSRRGQLEAASWAPVFAGYYAQNDGWDGVETLAKGLPSARVSSESLGRGRGGGTGRGQTMAGGVGDRLVLADADGRVVLDSYARTTGRTLEADDLAQGAPVMTDGELVGTLLIAAPESGAFAALTDDFLSALNRGALLAATVAGLVAILLAVVLVRQMIAPLRNLQAAAIAIASGDLSQRVEVTSGDELGSVGKTFNQMAETLERGERLRRNMMADVAHELRTPLTVIQGQVEALLDGVFPLTPDQLTPIHDQTILLARLVADLRDLALAEAGKLTLDCRPTEVGDLAGRVAAAVDPIAVEKGIDLTVTVPADLPAVSADGERLKQVLHNMLSNALRHTPPGGQITISVELASALSPVAPSPPDLRVTVADTGSGISEEEIPYIFDRFYRADRSRSQVGGGSGLGLSISRGIVEAHGGRIWAQSQPSRGTQITFTLPVPSSSE
ncbi:MAG: HAMP domain-containing protein [Ardenticatenia bacterium]|nr:HAMP domain-containing protein [Ardenticatenia bacterium]